VVDHNLAFANRTMNGVVLELYVPAIRLEVASTESGNAVQDVIENTQNDLFAHNTDLRCHIPEPVDPYSAVCGGNNLSMYCHWGYNNLVHELPNDECFGGVDNDHKLDFLVAGSPRMSASAYLKIDGELCLRLGP